MAGGLAPTAQQAIAKAGLTPDFGTCPRPGGGEGGPRTSRAGALDSSSATGTRGCRQENEEKKIETPSAAAEPSAAEPTSDAPLVRRPRRRHRNPQSRTRKLTVRLNEDEEAEIAAAAASRAVTVGRFIATSAISAARGHSAAADPQDRLDRAVDELVISRAQLARVGNNLNQLTFGFHAAGYVQPAELALTLGAVRKAVVVVDDTAAKLVNGGPLGP
ncbi:plasmid mobilization protein [Kitasatospora sp. NPDC086801]|uniref:plasmid mobilization protein n=1 Tax=unclassified Kitasatospora TaxID=2633591 RepID=UPI00381F6D1F